MSRIWSWLWNHIVGYYKWKKGDNTDIFNLQKSFIWLLFTIDYIFRKRPSHIFYRTRRRSFFCVNRCYSSRIMRCYVNSAIFWHCGLRWFTILPITSHVFFWVHIRGYDRPLKCVNRLLLPEFSNNARSAWYGVIVQKDRQSANGWLSKWGITCALSTLSRYAMALTIAL